MNAAQVIAKIERIEVDGEVAADCRRTLMDERVTLLAAINSGDRERIGAALNEAKRVLELWSGHY